VLLLTIVCEALGGAFIGPAGPRAPTGTGSITAEPAPTVGGGLTPEEVRSMLKHRHAVVIAGDDVLTALYVAEGLVEVGASVVLGCNQPERVRKAADERMMLLEPPSAASGSADDATEAQMAAAGEDAAADGADACEGMWQAGCEVRALDLASPAAIHRFADDLLAEERPLHVIVNCADDVEPFFRLSPESGWAPTVARNHLGPFLLTQLLLDRVVGTMRSDFKALREELRDESQRSRGRGGGWWWPLRRRHGQGGEWEEAAVSARGAEGGDSPAAGAAGTRAGMQEERGGLRALPYPAPLGRVVWLGKHARVPESANAEPPAVRGLFLDTKNYTGWRAHRCAHEANTLAAVQLSRMLTASPAPNGEIVEVNVVRPPQGRWLPTPLRRGLKVSRSAALTATFLASTPIRGINGLLFDSFTSEHPWHKSAISHGDARQRRAARQLYGASMSLVGSPAAKWRAEAAMATRGFLARQRRRPAVVRGRNAGGRDVASGGEAGVSEEVLSSGAERELDAAALVAGNTPSAQPAQPPQH
jgi:NAD(P)-dependent dehydrogenase (short-subunit alcohol dehydrogenase family)